MGKCNRSMTSKNRVLEQCQEEDIVRQKYLNKMEFYFRPSSRTMTRKNITEETIKIVIKPCPFNLPL